MKMKIKLLTALAVSLSLSGYAQIKGTSALSLGVNVSTNKTEYNDVSGNITVPTSEYKSRSFTLGYGFFVKDNSKIGIELIYGKTKNTYDDIVIGSKNDTYGGNVSYQKYYPLLKGLYVYAGGKAGYSYSKFTNNNSDNISDVTKTDKYLVGAYGGITWFLSSRFAFETNLLSANIDYSKSEQNDSTNGYDYKNKNTNFNLTTQGFIDNLGFKIYLLF